MEELPASSNLSDDIYRALDNSQYLIVICSRAMTQSPWVTREVLYFLEHHDQDNVFTVLVDGEPGEVFPKVLLQKTLPDGTRVDVEPLAMDVRAENQAGTLKKVRREINRLLAALIGCPYDALVQRQQKRQRRRLLVGAGVNAKVITAFREQFPQARAFHMSGKTELESGMKFRREGVPMGLPGLDEWHIQQTSEEAVREARTAVYE